MYCTLLSDYIITSSPLLVHDIMHIITLRLLYCYVHCHIPLNPSASGIPLIHMIMIRCPHIAFLIGVLIIDNPFIPFYFPIMVWIFLDIIIGTYLIYLSTKFKS